MFAGLDEDRIGSVPQPVPLDYQGNLTPFGRCGVTMRR